MVDPKTISQELARIGFSDELKQEVKDFESFKDRFDLHIAELAAKYINNCSWWDAALGWDDQAEKIQSFRSGLEELENRLVTLIDELAAESDPIKKLRKEQEFEKLRKSITATKVDLLSRIRAFKPDVIDYDSEIERYKSILAKIEEEIALIDQQLTRLKHPNRDRIEKEREELLRFMSEEVQKITSEQLDSIKAGVDRMIREIGSTNDLARFVEIKFDFLELLQQLDIERVEQLMSKRNEPSVHSELIKIDRKLSQRRRLMGELKPIPEESKDIAGAIEFIDHEAPVLAAYTANSKHRVEEVWSKKVWGRLLIQKDESSFFGADSFIEKINTLKERKRHVKEELKAQPENKELHELEREIKRELYDTLLLRLIDVIGDKEWEVRELKEHNAPRQLELVRSDLEILNDKFFRLLEKYRSIPSAKRSLGQGLSDQLIQAVTFGFGGGRRSTSNELLAKKRYADMGYSMSRYMQKWLKEARIPEGKTAQQYLQDQVTEFLRWAEEHPQKAATMAGDMSLTVALLAGTDQSYTEQFRRTLEAKAYTMAFMAPFAGPEWEAIETERELKYRALADLSRYAPLLAGAGRNAAESLFSGNFNLPKMLFDVGRGVIEAKAVQSAADLVPVEYAQIASAVASVAQGRSFRQVLESQRNIELARMGGAAVKAYTNPKGLVRDVGRRLQTWAKTMRFAKGKEFVTRIGIQVALPTASFVGAATIAGIAIAGGPISLAAAATAAGALLLFGGGILQRSNNTLNTIFPKAVRQARAEVNREGERRAEKMLLEDYREDVTKARDNYIRDLQAARQLPYVRPPEGLNLNDTERVAVNKIIMDLGDYYVKQLRKVDRENGDVVAHYNRQFKQGEVMQQIKERIASDPRIKRGLIEQENISGYILYYIQNQLMEQWVRPEIEKEMLKSAVRLGQEKIEGQDKKDSIESIKANLSLALKQALQKTMKVEKADEASDTYIKIWEQNRADLEGRDEGLYNRTAEAA